MQYTMFFFFWVEYDTVTITYLETYVVCEQAIDWVKKGVPWTILHCKRVPRFKKKKKKSWEALI